MNQRAGTGKLERIEFPEGFEVLDSTLVRAYEDENSPPVVTAAISGFLVFNLAASRILAGARGENIAVFLAYNPKTKVLALKPVPYHLKPPRTYKLAKTGQGENVFAISFEKISRIWSIPLDGKKYPCTWEEKYGILNLLIANPL